MKHKKQNMEHRTQTEEHGILRTDSGSVLCSVVRVSSQGGFSIIETIVAIAVLSIAMVAPLTLAQKGLNSSVYARDQVTAFYLAQEAIEYVRNVRDNNNLLGYSQSSDWLRYGGVKLDNLCPSVNNECGVDLSNPASPRVFLCKADLGGANCLLTFNSTNGIYGDQRGNDGTPIAPAVNSPFTRTLVVEPLDIDKDGNNYDAANLTATVKWNNGMIQRSIVIKERIFDWYPKPL